MGKYVEILGLSVGIVCGLVWVSVVCGVWFSGLGY